METLNQEKTKLTRELKATRKTLAKDRLDLEKVERDLRIAKRDEESFFRKKALPIGLAAAGFVAAVGYGAKKTVDYMGQGEKHPPTKNTLHIENTTNKPVGIKIPSEANLSAMAEDAQFKKFNEEMGKKRKAEEASKIERIHTPTAQELLDKNRLDMAKGIKLAPIPEQTPAPAMAREQAPKPPTADELKAKIRADIEAKYGAELAKKQTEIDKIKARMAAMEKEKAAADAKPNPDKMNDDEFYKYYSQNPGAYMTGTQAMRWNNIIQRKNRPGATGGSAYYWGPPPRR